MPEIASARLGRLAVLLCEQLSFQSTRYQMAPAHCGHNAPDAWGSFTTSQPSRGRSPEVVSRAPQLPSICGAQLPSVSAARAELQSNPISSTAQHKHRHHKKGTRTADA